MPPCHEELTPCSTTAPTRQSPQTHRKAAAATKIPHAPSETWHRQEQLVNYMFYELE